MVSLPVRSTEDTVADMNVKVTDLQMLSTTARIVPAPRGGLEVVHARKPTVRSSRTARAKAGQRKGLLVGILPASG
jgi:hypothetical protein